MSEPTPVILIDDDVELLKATAQTIELAGFGVSRFSKASQALAVLDAGFGGVVVSDIRMPDIDGLELFERIRRLDPDLPVILMTGHGDIPMAVAAIRNGVYDFIAKPFATDQLVQSLRRAAEKRRLVLENRALRVAAETAHDDLPLIGQTPAMERLRRTLRQIADTDIDVLVTGETGSGKEVVASAAASLEPARQVQFRRAELRLAARNPDRERAIRPRSRRLHRRAEEAHRPHRAFERRHALPR